MVTYKFIFRYAGNDYFKDQEVAGQIIHMIMPYTEDIIRNIEYVGVNIDTPWSILNP
jgi:hypothetical protein